MDYNICFAGAAGDGIKEAGVITAKIFSKLGYHSFIYQEYQSLIRGGHNASIVRVSDKKVRTHRYYYDLLICLEDYIYKIHERRVKGEVIYDAKFQCKGLAVPMTEFVREEHEPLIFRNAVAIGVLAFLFGIDFEIVKKTFFDEYRDKAEADIILARDGFEYAKDNFEKIDEVEKIGEEREVYSGNEAVAIGMLKAGLKNYYAYPMTPTSPILHFLVKRDDVIALQAESEISAIMMAIGSAYAGNKAATASSGGGFALMTESISLAGMAEIPIMVVLGQRSAPSTGMATYTAQEDLYFALNPAHGEFPLIVASPFSIEDAFLLSATLLNLSWKYQTPSILLSEKHLLESYETVEFSDIRNEEIEIVRESKGIFKRYEITDSGVSPYAVPPAIVKANSNEHDEFGITTDKAEIAEKMYAKRMRKEEMIEREVRNLEPYFIYGRGEETIVTWGSNFGAVAEVADELGFKVIVIRFLRPLIIPNIKDNSICVECNYKGLLARIIEKEKGILLKKILRWDGRPFTPDELKERIKN